MDPLVLLQSVDDGTAEDVPVSPKKNKKRRMSTFSRKVQAKLAEEIRQQTIRQRQEYLKDTKIRVVNEWEANHAKAQIYESEFQWRLAELEKSFKVLTEVEEHWNERQKHLRSQEEWQQYMSNTRLPDPSSVPQMNSYIFVWTEIEKSNQMSYCITKTDEVIKLLNGLEVLINYPGPNSTAKSIESMKELRSEMRRLLQENIDRATFYLFSRIETDMVPINVTTSKYSAKCPHFIMSLWAELITPIPSTRGKEIRHPLKVFFEETEVTVIVPVSLLDIHKVMRSMWLSFDHWSDKCRTYDCSAFPDYYKLDLLQLFTNETEMKLEIMSHREKLEAVQRRKIAAVPAEPTLSQEILAWDSEPQRALSDEVAFREWEEEDEYGRKVIAMLNEYEVNLRTRTVLGDLLLVEVIHQPPQPKYLRFKHNVTLRQSPPKLKNVEFYEKFNIFSDADEEKQNEVDTKKEKPRFKSFSKLDFLEGKKKLAEIHLKPPQSVIWFEDPQIACWNPVQGYWSTEDIHDVHHMDEEGTMAFKTGRFGLMGLHVNRYCNLPYEDWLFETDGEEGVSFYLKTSKVELNFKIRAGEVCLESTKYIPVKALDKILGTYYTPVKLMEVLRKKGIDVFPAPDASAYLDDVKSKHIVVETNIYQVWGLFSQSFRFKRSKFNQLAGRKNIVFQAQEIYDGHQVDYCLIQNSMCMCYVLDIIEDSNAYSSEPAPYMQAYVELYGLLFNNSTLKARRRSDTTNFILVQTVKEFLRLVRPLSFS